MTLTEPRDRFRAIVRLAALAADTWPGYAEASTSASEQYDECVTQLAEAHGVFRNVRARMTALTTTSTEASA